ncbi:alpha-L-rhamnosidase-like protein [Diaminobutyricimonas aerilata]|uniref:Alpha-L-rhamnosidase-like protein n=1 Tax=Diaminobutyricimonas aerilata TaxID=1162967 RepID=A0A2M9CFJ9_9MICO|nr:alpha-L-rhamnosidase C-terminal domain-containing protein [Diaminobutyricimonas aerilata]PJJ70659.1 alpha-L-rhamnosidase-like protein [Diaminobutyricimonas aerilata]
MPLASRDEILAAARRASRDPFPDLPEDPRPVSWMYGPGQYELAVLHRLVRDGLAANRFAHYAQNFGVLDARSVFRADALGPTGRLVVAATGTPTVTADGADVPAAAVPDGWAIELPAAVRRITVVVEPAPGGPAAIAVLAGDGLLAPSWSDAAGHPLTVRPGTRDTAPHALGEPVVELVPLGDRAHYALPAAALARVVMRAPERPTLMSGESLAEAAAAPHEAETAHEVVATGTGRWASRHELGFRHLTVTDPVPEAVSVEARIRPVPRRGAFVCSDDTLTRIWATSAYTLRLCLQGLVIDGIKRDRMPWAGDLALSTLANAFAFADADITRDTIVALGSPRDGYVNGISDYSLWWLISTAFYRRHFDDPHFAREEAERVHAFVERLVADVDARGLFRPRSVPSGFSSGNDGGVFIDWGVRVPPGRSSTALQVLWVWALRSAERLLVDATHAGAERVAEAARSAERALRADAWDARRGVWREHLEQPSEPDAYANLLAVLSGLTDAGESPAVVEAIGATAGRTPFMASFALRALGVAGHRAAAVDRIRRDWGAMLDTGGTTFWEEFADPGESPYAMYGRPFGKSLCHAWAAGPAALLPELVLGIRPLADGWTRVAVDPDLGDLEWAAAVVPLPHGDLVVRADGDGVHVDVPPGTVLVRDGADTPGPARVSWSLAP